MANKIRSVEESIQRIDRLEHLFISDLKTAKEELKSIAIYLRDSGLFPDREVLIRTSNGWVPDFRRYERMRPKYADDVLLVDDGKVYRPCYNVSAIEYSNLPPYMWAFLKWDDKYEVEDAIYIQYREYIVNTLRFVLRLGSQ